MSNIIQNFPYNKVTPVFTIREMLNIALEEASDKIAYKFRLQGDEIKEVTYKEFIRDVNAIGAALTELGVIGDHIAQIGENSYRWITIYLAALAGNGVYVPIDKELPEADVANIVNHSDSTVLFYSSKYDEIIKKNADTSLSNIKYFIRVEGPTEETSSYDDPRFLSYNEILRRGNEILDSGNEEYLALHSDLNELKMIVYTSGTTGMVKGVMLSEHNLMSIVYYGLQVATIYDTGLSVLPYHHTYEAVAGLLVAIHYHATLCINENLKTVLKNLQTYKPDYVYLVPAFAEEFYRRIWATAKKTGKEKGLRALIKMSNGLRKVGIDARRKLFATVHQNFGGNLREIVCGGAPLRSEIGDFFEAIGIPLLNGYGITECSPLVSVNSELYHNDPSTVGVVLPCCEVKFEDVTSEGIGEICVKGDIVMMGYYKQPDVTAEVLSEDGWFRTGDYGMMNDLGQLLITGRKKNIIVLNNGKNVYPEEIENYIQGIPYIKEVVVYGLKNEFGEEYKLCAEVFLNAEKVEEMGIADTASSLKADIAKACSGLPTYKNIGKIVIRANEFDKTTTNKIKRQSIGKDVKDDEK